MAAHCKHSAPDGSAACTTRTHAGDAAGILQMLLMASVVTVAVRVGSFAIPARCVLTTASFTKLRGIRCATCAAWLSMMVSDACVFNETASRLKKALTAMRVSGLLSGTFLSMNSDVGNWKLGVLSGMTSYPT